MGFSWGGSLKRSFGGLWKNLIFCKKNNKGNIKVKEKAILKNYGKRKEKKRKRKKTRKEKK
jgi:hypothetical protein